MTALQKGTNRYTGLATVHDAVEGTTYEMYYVLN